MRANAALASWLCDGELNIISPDYDVKASKERKEEERKPRARRASNPQPHYHELSVHTTALQLRPLVPVLCCGF